MSRVETTRPSAPLRDRGNTFIEIVVAVTLMAILAVPIMDAVVTGINASSSSRSAAQVETTVVNAADRVNRAPKSCSYAEYVTAAVLSRQWEADRASVQEFHYVAPADLRQTGTWEPGGCPPGYQEPPDLLIQKVIVGVTSPDDKAHREIEVVKSDV